MRRVHPEPSNLLKEDQCSTGLSSSRLVVAQPTILMTLLRPADLWYDLDTDKTTSIFIPTDKHAVKIACSTQNSTNKIFITCLSIG